MIETDPFRFEQQALVFHRIGVCTRAQRAARIDHAMPGNFRTLAERGQRVAHLAGSAAAGYIGEFGDLAIRRDKACRDFTHNPPHALIAIDASVRGAFRRRVTIHMTYPGKSAVRTNVRVIALRRCISPVVTPPACCGLAASSVPPFCGPSRTLSCLHPFGHRFEDEDLTTITTEREPPVADHIVIDRSQRAEEGPFECVRVGT